MQLLQKDTSKQSQALMETILAKMDGLNKPRRKFIVYIITPHQDIFWSGCLGKAVKGLEIGGLAAVDVDNNTALCLEAIQTPNQTTLSQRGQSLLDHYAQLFIERKEKLETLSGYGVVDGTLPKSLL